MRERAASDAYNILQFSSQACFLCSSGKIKPEYEGKRAEIDGTGNEICLTCEGGR